MASAIIRDVEDDFRDVGSNNFCSRVLLRCFVSAGELGRLRPVDDMSSIVLDTFRPKDSEDLTRQPARALLRCVDASSESRLYGCLIVRRHVESACS